MPNYSNRERNLAIVHFIETYDWSYQLVGDKFGVSRNTVAGIMFRHHHPLKDRVSSPGARGANKIGTGWHAPKYFPSVNAWNSFVERGELA